MTSRNPDSAEDFACPDCSDVGYGPQRLDTSISAYEGFLDPVCGTDDLSSHLALELLADGTHRCRHPPGRTGLRFHRRQAQGLL
jgi:hypothetical protein